MKKEAKPHINFTLKNNSIYLIRELSDLSKVPVSINTENIFDMFEWEREDPKYSSYRSTNLELWAKYREVDFSEWIDFNEKPTLTPKKNIKIAVLISSVVAFLIIALIVAIILYGKQ